MKKTIVALTVSSIALSTLASEATDKKWNDLLKASKFDPSTQSYCYIDKIGNLEGKNVDLKVRLASVSKLITSLWAIEKYGVDHRFETKLYIHNNNLHIKGSFDPFFGNEKAYYLLSSLNRLGYKNFNRITFDKSFIVYPGAQSHINEHPIINSKTIASNLQTYFNTKAWSTIYRDEYKRIALLTKNLPEETRISTDVEFSVNEIQFLETNPFESEASAKVLTLTSPTLKEYLKEINVKSNNFASQMLFRSLGGEAKLTEFLKSTYNLSEAEIKLYTGSGLPAIIEGTRKDNYSTCRVLSGLVQEMKDSVEKQDAKISDIIAVPGSDQGTFRRRIFSEESKNSVMAKTGTLMHTSTLAGALSAKDTFSFFGVFNQTSDIATAKAIQDKMVINILNELGGPSKFEYKPIPFYSMDEKIALKNFGEEELFISFDGFKAE